MNDSAATHQAVLCLGSNCGDSQGAFSRALAAILGIANIKSESEAYLTPPAYAGGHNESRPYLNMVLRIETSLCREKLDTQLKRMEADAGRDEQCRLRGDVPLDIDIVIFDGQVIRTRDYGSEYFRIGFASLKPYC